MSRLDAVNAPKNKSAQRYGFAKKESEIRGNTVCPYDREGLTVTYSPLIGILNPSKHEAVTSCISEMSDD